MTPRVPLVCTPEEFRAFAWAMADYVRTLAAGPAIQLDADYARLVATMDALFRPAEERKEAERNTGFDSRSGATLPSSSGAGMANPVAGGRAPGQDALSSAPAAPPPAGEPAWMTPELRKNLDCMVFVDAQVFSQARASMVAAIDHAVLSALAAIRAENERLRREMEARA